MAVENTDEAFNTVEIELLVLAYHVDGIVDLKYRDLDSPHSRD